MNITLAIIQATQTPKNIVQKLSYIRKKKHVKKIVFYAKMKQQIRNIFAIPVPTI